jgi:hypothetical protein
MACHGPAGAGMPGPTYPALGGQHADYTSLRLNEFRAGTDPLVPASRLEIHRLERLPDGRIRVTWNSNQDRPAPWTVTYSLYVREDMDLGDWIRLASGLLPEGVLSAFVWTPGSSDRLFLKIEAR